MVFTVFWRNSENMFYPAKKEKAEEILHSFLDKILDQTQF